MHSGESSLNWDFTAVIDLLHTPTHHIEDHTRYCDPFDSGINNAPTQPSRQNSISRDDAAYQRLGDFGSLWETLKPAPSLPLDSTPTVKPRNTSRPHSEVVPRSSPKVVTILKRVAAHVTTVHDVLEHAGSSENTSDTGAETDSDGDRSLFDPPISSEPIPLPVAFSSGTNAGDVDSWLTPPSSCDEVERTKDSNPRNTNPNVLLTKYNSAFARKAGLISKLLKGFPDCAIGTGLRGPGDSGTERTSSPALQIHVFIDSSNIMIGFHDCFKISRNIPVKTRMQHLPFSFRNLSFILERGRPTVKRVLVGSDRVPAIREAEKLGYETNILDRVYKAKQQTPRQLKFQNIKNYGGHGLSGDSRMPECFEERWVEQGVDEILHLKILESLVDTEKPGVIALATGDAAKAEYSGGFLKMVERALQKGWTIELASFSRNTSQAYKQKMFRLRWGSQFKIIQLDDYIEELLDV